MKTGTIIPFIILLFISCGSKDDKTILPKDCTLETGDIVFRRGGGLSSRAVLMADNNGRYSHVGIVVDSAGKKMIVHAVPDEPDYPGDYDRVKMECPESFFDYMKASTGEVRRLKTDTSRAIKAARYAKEIYYRRTRFDHDYNDDDTTEMYCCELVEHVYSKTEISLSNGKKHTINLPGIKEIHCILPSDICNSDLLKKIKSF